MYRYQNGKVDKRSFQNRIPYLSSNEKKAKEIKLPRCHLTLPAYLTIHCSKLNEPTIQKETIYLTELPNTVLDLKHAISVKLDIPIICMLELSVESMRLYDEQSIEEDIPLRDSDELHLVYLYRCQPGQLSSLMIHEKVISEFYNKYLVDNYHSQFALNADINSLIDSLHKISTNYLSPWSTSKTSSSKLFLIERNIICKLIEVWIFAFKIKHMLLFEECAFLLWQFDENIEERLVLFKAKFHDIVLPLFYYCKKPNTIIKNISIGLLGGYSEFSLGRKVILSTRSFIYDIVSRFNDYEDSTKSNIIDIIMPIIPYSSNNMGTINGKELAQMLWNSCCTYNFKSNDKLELHYHISLYFITYMKNYTINSFKPKFFKQMLNNFRSCRGDIDHVIAREESRSTSWGSILPFIDLFFIPTNSPLYQYEHQCSGLLDAYYGVARISLSAVLYQQNNRELCLEENLYGYLIILYWRQAKHPDNKRLLHGILNRFNPIPYWIPSLLQIATAQHAFNNQGLLAALDIF